jgi:hypothetical protein
LAQTTQDEQGPSSSAIRESQPDELSGAKSNAGDREGGTTMSSQQAGTNGTARQGAKKPKCTPEELRARSRANGARSRGPTSAAGLEKCRTSRQTHGLTSQFIRPLPNEDPHALAAKVQWWYDYYRPQSPAAHLMTTICAHSDVTIHRCYTFLASELGGQAGAVARDWEAARQRALARAVETLATDPREGLAELRSFSHGCRWLLSRWSDYQSGLATYGYWPANVWPEVIRVMFGADPHPDRITDAGARTYLAVLYNLRCLPEAELGEDQLIGFCAPRRRPPALQGKDLPAAIPAPAACRAWLQELVAERIAKLERLESSLRLGQERAELDRLIEKAALPEDDEASRQYLRYHGESCSKFLRTFDKLPRELQRDASGFYDDDEPAPTDRPDQPPLDPSDPGPTPGPARDHSPVDSPVGPSPTGAAETSAETSQDRPAPDGPSDALPAAAELSPDEVATRPHPPAFPDGPSRALPPAAELAPDEAAADPNPPAFPDGPGRALPAVSGVRHVVGNSAAPLVRVVCAGRDEESPLPHDRAPPGPRRDSPQARDGRPHAVP